MKPDDDIQLQKDKQDEENPAPISGDVIGDTAYSERFVLKLLLKFANLETLKDEMKKKSFEEDLCTLWDMTAESDVVKFLQKYKIHNLFKFALPAVESPRILEIIIGIIANMSCEKQVVADLIENREFLTTLVEHITHEDSLVLVQVLRFVSSSLFHAVDDVISLWIDIFEEVGYSYALYFILKNSSHKNLLINALENLNTVCSNCNTEKFKSKFYHHFVKQEALEALSTAFVELNTTQSEQCDKEEIERMLIITLQISLNLLSFVESLEIFSSRKDDLTTIIEFILNYYYNKIVNQKEIDTDLTDVIDSTATIVTTCNLSENCNIEKFFVQTHSIWKTLQKTMKTDRNGSSDFEEQDKDELNAFSEEIEAPLCNLMCRYIEKCSEENLQQVLDKIGPSLEDILAHVSDEKLKITTSKRTENFRSRLKDDVDS